MAAVTSNVQSFKDGTTEWAGLVCTELFRTSASGLAMTWLPLRDGDWEMYRSIELAAARRRRTTSMLVGFVAVAVTLSACGSSGSGTGSGPSAGGVSSSAQSVDTSLLGPDNAAAGQPVKIGFIYDGQSANVDTTPQVVAARAVVKYADAKLGGIGGRPIQLVECETKSDPTTDCGDQMVAQKVIAAVGGQMGEVPQVEKSLSQAGIPYIDSNNQAGQFSLTNFLLAVGAPVEYAKQQGIKHAAYVTISLASSVSEVSAFSSKLFAQIGGTVDVVGVPVGTADQTPQIQAETGKNPGLLHLIGNDTFCASALKAIKTLGVQAKITGINRCLSKAAAGSVPGGFAGLTIFSSIDLSPNDPQAKLYEAFRSVYLPGVEDNPDLQTGFQAMLGFVRGVDAGKIATFTTAGVTAALKAMPATPLPIGGGITYSCNAKAIPVFKTICSVGSIVSDATADGGQINFRRIDDAAIYRFGG
jgi:branched-chain amino acid transport system substrate-binding protein